MHANACSLTYLACSATHCQLQSEQMSISWLKLALAAHMIAVPAGFHMLLDDLVSNKMQLMHLSMLSWAICHSLVIMLDFAYKVYRTQDETLIMTM